MNDKQRKINHNTNNTDDNKNKKDSINNIKKKIGGKKTHDE